MGFSALGNSILAISIVFPLLAVFTVLLRIYARRMKKAALGWDDWLTIISTILCVSAGILNIWGVTVYVLGVEFEELETDMTRFVYFQKIIFINPSILMPALSLIKISILCFYNRIFIKPGFKKVSNVLIVICALWGISTFLCQVFEQFPVSDNWTTDLSGAHTNFTLSYAPFLMAWSALDLTLDVIILCMPAFAIRSLHLETKKKIMLTGIFGLGALCVISECIRIYYQYVFLYEPNESAEILFSSTLINILIWSTIEPCVSVIAACLPTLGPIFLHGQSPESLIRSVRSLFSIRSTFSRSNARTDEFSRRSQESETPIASGTSSQHLHEEWNKINKTGETVILSDVKPITKHDGIIVKKSFANHSDAV